MSSPTPTADGVKSQAPDHNELVHSCRALAERLNNTSEVLAALASSAEGAEDPAFEGRLNAASKRLLEVVAILQGERVGGRSRCSIGQTPGASVFRGRNDLSSLVDFISLLSHMGRSGVLEVHTAKTDYTLQLEQGSVVYAHGGVQEGLRIGDLLVNQGSVTEQQLEDAIRDKRDDEVLGDALLRLELITQEDLDTALTRQMSQLFGRMHEVGTGFDFVFEEGVHILENSRTRQGTSMLLLEGARLLDEGGLVRPDLQDTIEDGLGDTWLAEFDEEPEDALNVETFRSFVEVLVLEEQLDLVCLPKAASRLFTACWRSDAQLEEIADLIAANPGLCAHLLRAAGGQLEGGLRKTVERLGIARMREFTLGLTLNGRPAEAGDWMVAMKSLCRTAAIAAEFGALLGESRIGDAEAGRMAALMVEIGKPAVLGAVLDIERECGSRLAPSAVAELIEEYHVEVGTWLAGHWSFPEQLTAIVEHHHDLDALDEPTAELARIALLSHELATFAQRVDRCDAARLEELPLFVEAGLAGAELFEILGHAGAIVTAVNRR